MKKTWYPNVIPIVIPLILAVIAVLARFAITNNLF
jgi:uncharacterized membrane protein YjdF